jgi:hypothetical protein
MDVFVAHYQGNPLMFVRDFVVGSFEIFFRSEDVGEHLLAVTQGEGLQCEQVSIPTSMHDVLLNCVRHHMGAGMLVCVALAGNARRPTEADYYGLERALVVAQRIFRVVVGERDAEAWRATIREADVAFED